MMRTSFNLYGTDEAVDEIRRELEAERQKDPSFPWSVGFREDDGHAIECETEQRDDARGKEFVLALSARHPNVAIVAADVVVDQDSREPVRVAFVTFRKGRCSVSK